MHSRKNYVRFDRNPSLDRYWSNGRFPHSYESRRAPSQYTGRFCQSASYQPRGPPGSLRRLSNSQPNVSTHSTVRWLSNNIRSITSNTRSYSRPRILTPVSSSFEKKQESTRSPAPKQSFDTIDGNVQIKDANETEKTHLSDLSSVLGLKSDNVRITIEPKPVEKQRLCVDLTLDEQPVQGMDVNQSEETLPMESNEPVEETPWSGVLEELKSRGDDKRQERLGDKAARKRFRNRRRSKIRSLQRSMSKFSIDSNREPTFSTNIYTKYASTKGFRHPRGNYFARNDAGASSSSSYHILPLLQQSYASRLKQWNSSSHPRPSILPSEPINFGPSPYERPPWLQQSSSFDSNPWNRPTFGENRHQIGQKFGNNLVSASNRSAGSLKRRRNPTNA